MVPQDALTAITSGAVDNNIPQDALKATTRGAVDNKSESSSQDALTATTSRAKTQGLVAKAETLEK